MKDYKKMNSQELLKRYLDGDSEISIRDIEKKENEEVFYYTLNQWSFGKEWLKPLVILPVFLFLIIKIDPIIFCGFIYLLAYVLFR